MVMIFTFLYLIPSKYVYRIYLLIFMALENKGIESWKMILNYSKLILTGVRCKCKVIYHHITTYFIVYFWSFTPPIVNSRNYELSSIWNIISKYCLLGFSCNFNFNCNVINKYFVNKNIHFCCFILIILCQQILFILYPFNVITKIIVKRLFCYIQQQQNIYIYTIIYIFLI